MFVINSLIYLPALLIAIVESMWKFQWLGKQDFSEA
jgi:hypothetical protein